MRSCRFLAAVVFSKHRSRIALVSVLSLLASATAQADAPFEALFPPPAAMADQALALAGKEHVVAPAPPTPEELEQLAAVVTQQAEWNNRVKAAETIGALGEQVFGDDISFYSGAVSFTQVDIDIPGNSALPMRVARTHSTAPPEGPTAPGMFGEWDLDIPYMSGVFARQVGWVTSDPIVANRNQRCSVQDGYVMPPTAFGNGGTGLAFGADQYWRGHHLYVPGVGDQSLLRRAPGYTQQPSDGQSYPWVTVNHWQIRCLTTLASGDAGEGFVALSPEGTQYFFDWMVKRPWSSLQRPIPGSNPTLYQDLDRDEIRLYPTRVRDRFGNEINYSYAADGKLQSIAANDGRAPVSFTYHPSYGSIATATHNGRTWTYSYSASKRLSSVLLPDNSSWTLATTPMIVVYSEDASVPPCTPGTWTTTTPRTYTFTHPSGAMGVFEFNLTRHSRNGVGAPYEHCHIEKGVVEPGPMKQFDSYAIARKTLSHSSIPTMQWNIGYASTIGTPSKTVTVTQPDASQNRLSFGTVYYHNEGKLLRQESLSSTATLLRDEVMSYATAPIAPAYTYQVGYSYVEEAFPTEFVVPQTSRTISQQGVNFASTTTAFDVLARPLASTQDSDLGPAQSSTQTYEDRSNLWVLGLPKTQTINGIVAAHTDYTASTALPESTYRFGKLEQRFTYYSDGTPATIQDGRNNTTTLSQWKMGIPKTSALASTQTISAEINDNGWVTSIRDELLNTTQYGYDALGRLNTLTPPTGDAVVWNNTNLSFAPTTAAYGLPNNHWQHTRSTGTARTTTHYDALWQPVVVKTEDTTLANSQRFVVKRYDVRGREIFTSYPVASLSTVNDALPGVATTYDALGRVLTQVADSELGALTTSTQYLPGFKIRVSNPRNQITTTEYLSWDEPSTELPTRIESPEGIVTTFTRDGFGKPTSITRSGTHLGIPISATRRYVYDDKQRLCKTIEPESGATIVEYDAADNILWRTQGSNLTALTCDRASVPLSERSLYSYDAMNRVIAIDHPAGTDDISYTYEADGALKTATTQGSTWTYAYNKRRLPTQESLAFDSQTFNLNWGYDSNGTANNLIYPSGLSVPFNPNALGEPQQIGSFASAISYHLNGALAGFTYGNNVLHSTTQNARQLPLRSRAQFNGSSIVDYTLTFDPNANPTLMSDAVAGAIETKSMTYDGLDRLIGASSMGTFGNAIIEYDPLDNIRRYAVNGRDWRYVIDNAKQQLTRINNPAGVQQVAYTYDPRGNMTSRNDDGITLSFNFDRAQRLLDNRYLSQVQQTYRYDAHGRRTESAQSNGDKRYQIYSRSGQYLYEALRPAGSPGQTRTTDYIYLGGTLIAKRVIEDIVVVPVLFKDGFETAALLAQPKYGVRELAPAVVALDPTLPQSNEEQRQQAAALHKTLTTTTYLHTDPLGSPVAETNTLGDVIKRNRFEPFGYPLNTPTEGQPSYTGHQFDSYTELIYAQQRYYDSKRGGFISIDPMVVNTGNAFNFNRYNYAANSPYKYIDPDGRCPICYGIGILLLSEPANAPAPGEATVNTSPGDALAAVVPPARALVPLKMMARGMEKTPNAAKVEKTPSGKRVEDFTKAQKDAAKAANAANNGGKMACTDCAKPVDSVANTKGVPTPPNQAQVHHDPPLKDGGTKNSKPVVLCPPCHQERHDNE